MFEMVGALLVAAWPLDGVAGASGATLGNVHGFHALEDSFLLIIGVYELDPAAGPVPRDYVDPEAGDVLADGSIRAPRLAAEDAFRRYLTT